MAHGCDPSYVPVGHPDPPCVAQHAPQGCLACNGRRGGLANGLRKACASAGSGFVTRDDEEVKKRKGWRGECAALPGQQGLYTFGSEVGQSYCGGTGCVFSRGWIASFPSSEIFRNRTECQGCTRGQQDVALSRCLFHHNPAAIAPIGIPGFFWGRPGERLIEQMLVHYDECVSATAGGGSRGAGARERLCVRRHGLMEWFTMHLQVRGAFTTLYHNLTPAVWQSTFRHGENAVPVPRLLQQTFALARSVSTHAEAQREAWSSRLCCGLLRRDIVPCNLGCTPWRMLSAYANSSGSRPLAPADAAACDANSRGRTSRGLWEQPAPRRAEMELLHPNRRQTWRNGAMKCDFCEGFFNGWRGL